MFLWASAGSGVACVQIVALKGESTRNPEYILYKVLFQAVSDLSRTTDNDLVWGLSNETAPYICKS